ncbi:zinc finger protein 705A-like isoform X8 [Dasypus novemcinctus]|uniref:zinc finger protein 705A-like isoform X8 n=1 Tax=Dasypus novemcinctus TaxID=9361 RepID=UPI00265EB6F3|nr:zinc finger protein 705A-like isoform X8 [Dasypus novemcinctus]
MLGDTVPELDPYKDSNKPGEDTQLNHYKNSGGHCLYITDKSSSIARQKLVSFKDVTIDFTEEEWILLDTSQRKLFRDVMVENINHLVSVGYQFCKSDVLSPLDQGEEVWREGIGLLPPNQNPSRKNVFKNQDVIEMIFTQPFCRNDTSNTIYLETETSIVGTSSSNKAIL